MRDTDRLFQFRTSRPGTPCQDTAPTAAGKNFAQVVIDTRMPSKLSVLRIVRTDHLAGLWIYQVDLATGGASDGLENFAFSIEHVISNKTLHLLAGDWASVETRCHSVYSLSGSNLSRLHASLPVHSGSCS
jgi:hypothetical protein